ncbi:polyglutamine-binding protein 1 [Danaus plexippus]|uniref:Polyglutamine-binding protein 1 n=1 Tax=Danaus plexippus plexippus TaxID=278856 RepID=A0A212F1M9_DANPL|nr:polyglutamine-binding protein 1 [Danaus plexippus]OWR47642.1 polyglutamine-binding protein 1 [Danaus plexippus plexippus]
MPLPPALAARLAKRGILKEPTNNDVSFETPTAQVNEEIIAEDYDNNTDQLNHNERFWEGIEGVNVDPIKGHKGCPNKSNIYHECSKYCVKTWKQGKPSPSDKYLEVKRKVLELWPLPPGWEEVYDEGTGHYYFWNVHNNLVSWLPPSHPRAIQSESAAHLREERLLREGDESDDSSEASDQEVPQQHQRMKRIDRKDREREMVHHRDKKRHRVKDNDLDPMDPASYSDIARGGWTAGLDAHAKTGVDSTASGSLYQMRPYPAPGAILAANAKGSPPSSPN